MVAPSVRDQLAAFRRQVPDPLVEDVLRLSGAERREGGVGVAVAVGTGLGVAVAVAVGNIADSRRAMAWALPIACLGCRSSVSRSPWPSEQPIAVGLGVGVAVELWPSEQPSPSGSACSDRRSLWALVLPARSVSGAGVAVEGLVLQGCGVAVDSGRWYIPFAVEAWRGQLPSRLEQDSVSRVGVAG